MRSSHSENESFVPKTRAAAINDSTTFSGSKTLRNLYLLITLAVINLAILIVVVNVFRESIVQIFSDRDYSIFGEPDLPILDAVVPIHFTDNYVSFDCHGIESVFKYFKPTPRKLYFIASDETKEKAENMTEYQNLYKKYGEKIIWVDEKIFPDDDWDFHYGKVVQQMLKMHIFERIPELGQNAVVVDADLRWVKPREMVYANGSGSYGFELHPQQRNALFVETLAPGLNLTYDSKAKWIEHHMLFQKDVMKDLFRRVIEDRGTKSFADAVSHWRDGRVTEYEFYRAFAFKYWPERVTPTRIPYIGSGFCNDETAKSVEPTDTVFLACHDHRLFGTTWDVFNSIWCWGNRNRNRTATPKDCGHLTQDEKRRWEV